MPRGKGYTVNDNSKCDPTAEKALNTLGQAKKMPAREAEKKLERMDPMARYERYERVGKKIDLKY